MGRFDSVKRPGPAARYALEEGEKELVKFTHGDPYCMVWMPGGSKFMRNPAPPLGAVYPNGGIPDDAEKGTNTPVWPDMVPVTARKEQPTSYLVDFSKKNME